MNSDGGWLIYVPGLMSGEATTRPLRRRLTSDLGGGWQSRYWHHGVRPWSTGSMSHVARRLHIQIATWLRDAEEAGESPRRIILVGHSIGGVMCRDAWLMSDEAAKTGEATEWSALVSRIVLLAAPNRGFDNSRLGLLTRPAYAVSALTTTLVVEDLRKGSPYITDLRLRWVQALRAGDRPTPLEVVQVLGDSDSRVKDDDSFDITYMPESIQMMVPNTTHSTLPLIDGNNEERYRELRRAVCGDLPRPNCREEPPTGRPVTILVHGIRAGTYGTWVRGVGDEVKKRSNNRAVVICPSYGYLTAVGFATPWVRRRQLRLLLDCYSEAFLRHGPTRMAFAGHSNGTYLLGTALQEVPAMTFHRVYLAGSVLPREYRWSRVFERKQVTDWQEPEAPAGTAIHAGEVHSDRGNKDWAVGWLCAALRGLGMNDVGVGGFEGFDQHDPRLAEHDHWFKGGHGVALEGCERQGLIASYLLSEQLEDEPDALIDPWFRRVGLALGATLPGVVVGGAALTTRWVVERHGWRRLGVVGALVWLAWAVGSSG